MPHVELSLSDDPGPEPGAGGRGDDAEAPLAGGPWASPLTAPRSSLKRWSEVAADAVEPCVVLDADGVIVASSRAGTALLAAPDDGDDWIGRGLLDVLELVDLTATGEPLAAWEAERIPPLLALSSGTLARGVIRVRIGELMRTLDTVSTPLRDGPAAVGSLTFLHRI
ncbi:MAG: hypothetical protein ACRDTM_09920 [Micromonosporaceae bacterium]